LAHSSSMHKRPKASGLSLENLVIHNCANTRWVLLVKI
jgi:hypothetical protein